MNKNSIKTLFLTRHLPFPPMGGAALRNWQNINIMLNYGEVAVVSIESKSTQNEAKHPLGVTLWRSYYTEDIKQQRSTLAKISQSFWYFQPKENPWYSQFYSTKIAQEILGILNEFKPQIVIFEEIWLYPYLQQLINYPGKFIYDAHNAEASLSKELARSARGIRYKLKSALLATKVKAIEADFVNQVDQVWVCSNYDASIMREMYNQNLSLQVVANGINVSDYAQIKLNNCSIPKNLQQNPHIIVFTAAYTYPPNAVAAQILIEQIYPQLRQTHPDCLLLLVGRNPTEQMKNASQDNSGIIVTGKVPEIYSYLAVASVVVVPLIEGGGTRLKILEAFAAGRAVVSTSKGVEGLTVQDGEHLLIRDKIEDIVEAVRRLWSDLSLRNKLVNSAYEMVQANYSWQAIAFNVEQAIEEL